MKSDGNRLISGRSSVMLNGTVPLVLLLLLTANVFIPGGSVLQCKTVQYNTLQYHTTQHNTIQYNKHISHKITSNTQDKPQYAKLHQKSTTYILQYWDSETSRN